MNQLCITINFNKKLVYINKHVHNSDYNTLILIPRVNIKIIHIL